MLKDWDLVSVLIRGLKFCSLNHLTVFNKDESLNDVSVCVWFDPVVELEGEKKVHTESGHEDVLNRFLQVTWQ